MIKDIMWEIGFYWGEFGSFLRDVFKYPVQRIIRGYDDRFIWSYNYHNAMQVLDVLRWYRFHRCGTTTKYTEEEFDELLEGAITGFNCYLLMDDTYDLKEWDKLNKIFQKGLKAYVKIYPHLWD